MITEKEFKFWNKLIKKEFKMDYHSIVHVVEPEDGIDNYCVIGYVDSNDTRSMAIRVDIPTYNKYKKRVKA